MLQEILLSTNTDPSYQAGRVIGSFVWPIVSIIALIKCYRIKGRETTNTSAVNALAFLFWAFLCATAFSATRLFAEPPAWTMFLQPILHVGLLVASVIYGVIGLTQIKIVEGKWIQGKKQAVWGICLSSIFIISIIGVPYTKTRLATLATETLAKVETTKEDSPDPVSANFVVNQEFNYKIAKPARPWIDIDAHSINPVAKTAFTRNHPNSFVMVIPEAFGVESHFEMDAYIDVIQANLKGVATNAVFTEVEEETQNGIEGKRFSATCRVSRQNLAYSFWAAIYQGHAYQVIVAIRDGDTNQAKKLGKQIAAGFHVLDKDLIRHDEDAPTVQPFTQKELGYTLDLYDLGWIEWADRLEDAPESDFGATYETFSNYFSTSIVYGDLKPSLSDLRDAFIENSFGIDQNETDRFTESFVDSNIGDTIDFSFSFTRDGQEIDVMTRLIARDSFALINTAYSTSDYRSAGYPEIMRKALEKVEFLEQEPDINSYLNSQTAEQLSFQKNVINEIGIYLDRRGNYADSYKFFELAHKQEPGDSVVIENMIHIANKREDYELATKVFESLKGETLGNQELIAKAAYAYYNKSDFNEAKRLYKNLFENGYNDEDDLLEYLNTLIDLDQRKEAIEFTRTFVEKHKSWRAHRWLASMLGDEGKFEEAYAEFKKLKKARPFQSLIDYDIAELHYEFGKYNKTIELAKSFPEKDDTSIIALKGKALYQLELYNKAKREFERVLELDPSDEDTKEWLAYTTNALGKSDQEVRKAPIPPVEIPENILAMILDSEEAKNTESSYLYSIVSIDFQPETHYKKTIREAVYIGDEATLEDFKALSLTYDPYATEIFVNSIEVLNTDGIVVSTADIEDFYVTSDTNSDMAVEDKILHAPVPGLRIGNTLRYTYTRSEGAPTVHPFESFYLTKSRPIHVRAITVKAPRDTYRIEQFNGVERLAEGDTEVLLSRSPQPYKWEPYQERVSKFLPRIKIGSATKQWDELTQDYLEDIRDLQKPEQSVLDTAAALAKDSKETSDKLYSIYEYIQQNYTYKAIEFGPRGRIPASSAETIANKYGDCKDLALLTKHLLEAKGIPAKLALINSNGDVAESLPSMDQFDHMILYLPEYKGGRFIDCTTHEASADLLTPLDLSDRKALVLDGENSRFVQVGSDDLEQNTLHSERTLQIRGHDLFVDETLSVGGATASYFRSYLKSIEPEKQFERIQSYIAGIAPDLQLTAFETNHLAASHLPLVLKLSYKTPNRVEIDTDGTALLRAPNLWERDYFAVNHLNERSTPFAIHSPLQMTSTVRLLLDGRQLLSEASKWAEEDKNDFHQFVRKLGHESEGTIPVITHSITLIPGSHTASQYNGFIQSAQNLINTLSRSIKLSARSEPSQTAQTPRK